MSITLEQQIEEAVRLSNCNDEPSIEYLDSILASLRRLQAIEQQEPVSWQFYQNSQWSHGSEYHNHRENTEQGGIPVRDLYALPVSPAIPEGYALLPIEPTVKMLDACLVNGATEAQRKVKNVYADIWSKMLAASKVTP